MSGKEFFVSRYEELGWKYEDVEQKQAIRINSVNARKADVAKRLESLWIELEKIPFLEDGYWIRKSEFSVGATSEYLLGLYSIQEAAAQIPVTLFTGLKDKIVLDACAAPGGKTVQLADLMQNTGVIIALDVKKRRLIALSNQLERCRVRNAIVYHMDARQASQLKIKFDRILLDVPCSGNFVTDKDWFNKRTIKDVKKNAKLQREILTEAAKVLKDDGEIVYATCSLEPEEDELNIDWAVKNLNLQVEKISCYGEKASTNIFGKQLDNSVENCRRIWPRQTQGFFACKLKKRACTQ
ncbi:MAG: RsmB/NOP family class I SAM-dependent RNA methyltransferase [Candidatus Bathyarchaeota archaeon]|nr:RsmB/NOP family class I SAM-dependent RNA methyltransferase [Candidatus Bathyarchaeota archaeon]MDH5596047.1 RsmB/NOP family class I SAM-dependent RNA methyltransferase [Candidatus Bathyarchaeota archaeon]